MARIETDPNYTPGFSRATEGTDIFKKEDVQGVAASLSSHDHASGKGLAVTRLGNLNQNVTFTNPNPQIVADSLTITPYTPNGHSTLVLIPNGTGNSSTINLYATAGVAATQYGTITSQTSGLLIMANRTAGAAFGAIYFYTNDAQRMTVGLGGVNIVDALLVGGNITTPSNLFASSVYVSSRSVSIGPPGAAYILSDASNNLYYRAGLHSFQVLDGSVGAQVQAETFYAHGDLVSDAGSFKDHAVGGGLWGRFSASRDGQLLVTTGDDYAALYCGPAGLLVTNFANNSRIANMTNVGGLAINGSLIVNQARGTNQGAVGFSAGLGQPYDVTLLAESGNLYVWFNGSAPLGMIVQGTSGAGGFRPVTASAFTVGSAVKFKENLAPLAAPLATVLDERVTPLTYTLKDSDVRSLGFTAEDMVKVVPDVVTLDDEGAPETINYGALVTVLWGAVRELSTRLQALEGEAA